LIVPRSFLGLLLPFFFFFHSSIYLFVIFLSIPLIYLELGVWNVVIC